jgi:hypothetical protein
MKDIFIVKGLATHAVDRDFGIKPDPAQQLHASVARVECAARMLRIRTDLQVLVVNPEVSNASRQVLYDMLKMLSILYPCNQW